MHFRDDVVGLDASILMHPTTWKASDLKDFPVQIKTKEKENTSIMRYQQVQFAKPDAKQFEAPVGYTKYSDNQELMQGLMKKMLSGGETK